MTDKEELEKTIRAAKTSIAYYKDMLEIQQKKMSEAEAKLKETENKT